MYITNQDLFQFSIVIISVITLVITVIKKKQSPRPEKTSDYSLIIHLRANRLYDLPYFTYIITQHFNLSNFGVNINE